MHHLIVVRQSPCETQVLPTDLLLLVVLALALFPILLTQCRCNNARRRLPIHNQPQSTREAAHLQAMHLQEIFRLVKLQDMDLLMVARRLVMGRVQVQVQRLTDHHLKDSRLVQALTFLTLNPESECRLGLPHPQATECDPRKCHHRSKRLKDRSEGSKRIFYPRHCVARGWYTLRFISQQLLFSF